MAVRLTFEVLGEKQLSRSIERYSENIKDLRSLWPQIKPEFYKGELEQFNSQTGRGPWAPLKSSKYALWKAENYPGAGLLERQGTLKRAMTTKGAPGLTWRETSMELGVVVTVPYASRHHKGGGGIRRREVIWLSEKTKQNFTRALHKWLVQQHKKAGLK